MKLPDVVNSKAGQKFWLSVICMTLIFVTGVAASFLTALAAQLSVLVGGYVGALTVYCGANALTNAANAGVEKAKNTATTTGQTGATGTAGVDGSKGAKGADGARGQRGPVGPAGPPVEQSNE